MASSEPDQTFLLVDGENIDATLGGSLLGRRPAPEERPRWDRVRDHAQAVWDQPVRGLFFLNASTHVPMSFVQALAALEFRPVLLSGPSDVKVVDLAIQRTLTALDERGHGDVLLASHDGDFAEHVAALLRDDGRRVGLIAFRELVSTALTELAPRGSRCSTWRTTSARSPSRCRASGSSRSTASTPGRSWTRAPRDVPRRRGVRALVDPRSGIVAPGDIDIGGGSSWRS